MQQELNSYDTLMRTLGIKIQYEMKKKEMDQNELARRAKQSQSTISNIISGKTCVSMKTVFSVMETLEMNPLNELSNLFQKNTNQYSSFAETLQQLNLDTSDNFICNPYDPLFNGYLGSYYTYFHSTNTNEDICLHGKLYIKATNQHCTAEFHLLTPPKPGDNPADKKVYQGYVFLSQFQTAIYIILVNNSIGEMCFLSFPYQRILSSEQKLECTMAMALTVSSGIDSRTPTVHRMFLSRKELDTESEMLIRSQLLLNKSQIHISKEKFDALCKSQALTPDFMKSFQHHMHEKIFYEIREDALRELPNNRIFFENLCTLRNSSISPRDNKINRGAISAIFHQIIKML